MTVQHRITRILSTLLIAGLCSAPLLRAQQTNPATPQQAPETSQQPQQPANDTARANNPGTAGQCARSSNGPGAEYSARGSGKSDSAAASIARNQREPVASASRARYHVS